MKTVPTTADIMLRSFVSVAPETDIYQAINKLLSYEITGAPVISMNSGSKELVGFLSEKDCLSVLSNGSFYNQPSGNVEDFMTRSVITARPEMDIFACADMFHKNSLRIAPVVNLRNRPVGIVMRRDILMASYKLLNYREPAHYDSGYLTDAIKARIGIV